MEQELHTRSGSTCELCGSTDNLAVHEVQPAAQLGADGYLLACGTCLPQIEDMDTAVPNHWRCLNDSMWSEVPAVQVTAWRMLTHLSGEGWPQDLLEMMYLDEETLKWARAFEGDVKIVHRDSNGTVLEQGDSVVLIKDLDVKGTSFVAKRGTAVRRISLVQDNEKHIEGKINGQHIVILTEFVKKSK